MTFDIRVRDATPTDLESLAQVRYAHAPAIHRDRLRDAASHALRYLVAEQDESILGFALLVFERPPSWSDAGDRERLPQIVDLFVRPESRGQGVGSAFIREMEQITIADGHGLLFVAVDPTENPRALALYRRLGYEPLQPEPRLVRWGFTDSAGVAHAGEDWLLDMSQVLAPA